MQDKSRQAHRLVVTRVAKYNQLLRIEEQLGSAASRIRRAALRFKNLGLDLVD